MIALGGIFLFILGVLVGIALSAIGEAKARRWKSEAEASRRERAEREARIR